MRVLITGGASRLSKALAASLGSAHVVTVTDRKAVTTGHPFVRSDLGHDESTNELVRSVDAIVHSGGPDIEASVSDQLDVAMRCTYNLLWAASEERVPRLIFLSSLTILDGYGEDLAVTERWRPVPTTEPSVLGYHLGEYVCREFARERKIAVLVLRLGELTWDSTGGSTSALYPEDAALAVAKALTAEALARDMFHEPSGWDIFHVQSAVPNARYLLTHAKDGLGYVPAQSG